ncbi:hypothetical protein D3C81_1545320 [compost metagenome]
MKRGQRRHQQQSGERTGHVHPQLAPRQGGGMRQARFDFFQCIEHLHDAFVIGRAIGRHVDLARGAVQQFQAQARLKLLHQLRHRGAAHVQGRGCPRKTARLDHPHERLHRIKPVHPRLHHPIVWIIQIVQSDLAALSGGWQQIKCSPGSNFAASTKES